MLQWSKTSVSSIDTKKNGEFITMKKEQAIKQIKAFSNANGVSGFEEEVVMLAKKTTKNLGRQEVDPMKNFYLYRKENTGNRPFIQFDAHSDEVGFIVQAIKPNGMLQILPVGGWIPHNISAQKVRIRNRLGKYLPGILTSIPPHFMTAAQREKTLTFDDLMVDVGATTAEEIKENYGIDIGAPIVPDVSCSYDEANNLMLGKAFDCRIGCACMFDVLDELAGEELACDLVATMTSQEEVGERGAIVAAQKVQSDLAIVFEGCPADELSEPYLIQSAMRKGPMLRYFDVSMITSPGFQSFAIQTAEEKQLPIQVSVRKGGGTNGAAIQAVQGAPAIVVGIPVRYAHTPHCYVAYEDYQAAKDLVIAIVRSLNKETIQQILYGWETE